MPVPLPLQVLAAIQQWAAAAHGLLQMQ